jgi:hypothetical protein
VNGTELREALKAKGITNGRRLAEYLGSPVVIFFVTSQKNNFVRAELLYEDPYGEPKSLVRSPGAGTNGLSQKRASAVERARVAAEGLCTYGRDDWSRAPFSNCWLPTEMISKLHEEFEKGA